MQAHRLLLLKFFLEHFSNILRIDDAEDDGDADIHMCFAHTIQTYIYSFIFSPACVDMKEQQ